MVTSLSCYIINSGCVRIVMRCHICNIKAKLKGYWKATAVDSNAWNWYIKPNSCMVTNLSCYILNSKCVRIVMCRNHSGWLPNSGTIQHTNLQIEHIHYSESLLSTNNRCYHTYEMIRFSSMTTSLSKKLILPTFWLGALVLLWTKNRCMPRTHTLCVVIISKAVSIC